MSGVGRAICAGLVALALAGCESARFGGPGLGTAQATARRAPSADAYNAPEPVEALPSGSVTSEPLPPPPGSPSVSGPVASLGPAISDVPTMPGSPRPIEGLNPSAPPPAASPVPPMSSGGGRSAHVGGWTARDATGATCRMTLSTSPALDLYRASSAGCQNRDLARVTAWDFRDGEVYLYQPGGAVAARLRSDGGSLAGVLAKSGAPLTLAR